ncbi:MAG: glucan biosynthesis protein [Hahellaceae bacterium]|nr:glucan biosynthesis protein [Hahellaceae bacterium]
MDLATAHQPPVTADQRLFRSDTARVWSDSTSTKAGRFSGSRSALSPTSLCLGHPPGDWGAGHVILVEIPSDSEANDNIVAYWRPDQTLAAGEPFPLEYRITWPDDVRQIKNLARVIRSARGLDFQKRHQVLTIDYDSNGGLTADKITPEVSLSSGKLISTVIR